MWYNINSGSVAQWIEQLRPKEKVVRSTRAGATKPNGVSSSERTIGQGQTATPHKKATKGNYDKVIIRWAT